MPRIRPHVLFLLAGTALWLVAPASAELISTVTLTDSYGSTDGGEFAMYFEEFPFEPASLAIGDAGIFETFCIEVDEHVDYGRLFCVDFGTAADGGGVGGGSPDPLDPLTAYLYTQFIGGTLDAYVYDTSDGGTARGECADALQHVIWFIEEEEDQTWVSGDGSLADLFYQNALDNAGPDIGDVLVMHLYWDAAGEEKAQDQLVLVPEPAAGLLAVVGLLCLRRRG